MKPAKIVSTNHCCPKLTKYTVSSPRNAHLSQRNLVLQIRTNQESKNKTLAALYCCVFFVEWGMAEDWEMQIELRNFAEGCFEIDISTIFEILKLIWEWMDELGQSSYIGKSAGRPWRAALYW